MDYKVIGEPMPVLICDVAPGEALITEGGAMSWMTPNMKMETTSAGGAGKALGRLFSGVLLPAAQAKHSADCSAESLCS
jgi:uncharacterized protein (AIM24 family)